MATTYDNTETPNQSASQKKDTPISMICQKLNNIAKNALSPTTISHPINEFEDHDKTFESDTSSTTSSSDPKDEEFEKAMQDPASFTHALYGHLSDQVPTYELPETSLEPDQLPPTPVTDAGFIYSGIETPTTNEESLGWIDYLSSKFKGLNTKLLEAIQSIIDMLFSLGAAINKKRTAQGLGDYVFNPIKALNDLYNFIKEKVVDFLTSILTDAMSKMAAESWEFLCELVRSFFLFVASVATGCKDMLSMAMAGFLDLVQSDTFQKIGKFGREHPLLYMLATIGVGMSIGTLVSIVLEILTIMYYLWVNRREFAINVATHSAGLGHAQDDTNRLYNLIGSILAPQFWTAVSHRCQEINTMSTTAIKAYTAVCAILTYYGNYLISLEIGVPMDQIPVVGCVRGADSFIKRYNEIMVPDEILKCRMDPKMRSKYVDLEKQADTLVQSLPTKIDPAARTLLMDYKSRVSRVVSANLNLPQGNVNKRVEPVSVIFYGPAGIGKTVAMLALQKAIAAAWGVPNTCLVRNVASEYFSDHCGQSFVQFDELQQRVMPIGQEQDMFEFIQMVNSSPFLMPVEICEQKCSAYANFSAVFATTNRVFLDYRHICSEEAFNRRVHFKLVPVWKKGVPFKHKDWPSLDLKSLASLDRHVPLDVADLYFLALDGNNKCVKVLSFNQLVEDMTALRDRFYKDAFPPESQVMSDKEFQDALANLYVPDLECIKKNDKEAKAVWVASILISLVMTRSHHSVAYFVRTYPKICAKFAKYKSPAALLGCDEDVLDKLISDSIPLYTKGQIQYVPVAEYHHYTQHIMQLIVNKMRDACILAAERLDNSEPEVIKRKLFKSWLDKAIPTVNEIQRRIDNCSVYKVFTWTTIFGSACGIIMYLVKIMRTPEEEESGHGENEYPDYKGHKVDKAPQKRIVQRWPKVPKGKSEGGYDSRCTEFANKVLNRNVVHLSALVVTPTSTKCIGAQHGIFVCGRILLTNKHFIARVKRCNQLEWANEFNTGTNRCSITALKFWEAPSGDFGLIHVGQCDLKPNIISGFVTEEEVQDICDADIIFTRPGHAALKTRAELSYGHAIISPKGKSFTDDEDNVYRTSTHIEYQIPTKAGDCGIPIFLRNTMLTGKIFGIHAATFGPTRNVGQLVSREQLQEGIDSFGEIGGSQMDSEFAATIPFEPPAEGTVNTIPCLNLVAVVPQKFATPTGMGTTALVPTPLQHKILKGSFKPAVTAAVGLPKGEDLILRNLATKHQHHFTGLAEEYDLAWSTLGEHMMVVSTPLELDVTTLTFTEAVNGIDAEPYIDRLPRNTAPGWPECKIFGVTDKKFLEKPGPNKLMQETVMAFLNQCKEGSPQIFFTLFGKDELRPVDKIDERNIRLVYGCPTHATIAFRMLFGPFAAWCMRNHTRNGVCVGMNPFGYDWHFLAERLLSKGQNLFDADIKKFDYNQSIELLSGFSKIVNRWANDDEETQRMRTNIWTSMMNAYVIYGTKIFQRTGNICSGCPVTALVNSLITIVFFLTAWMRIFKEKKMKESDPRTFFTHCFIASFGDDNIISVVDKIADIFTPRAIVDTLGKLNIVLTSSDKGKFEPNEPIPWKKLSEIQFLKRSFVFDKALDRYCSPLSIDSIQKMVCWVRKSPDFNGAWRTNLQNAAVELSQHGQTTYEHHANQWTLHLSCMGYKNFATRSYITARKELECRSLESYLDLEEYGDAQMGFNYNPPPTPTSSYQLIDVYCDAPPAPANHHCALTNQHCDFNDCDKKHCDFDVWMAENKEMYDINALPVLDEFNLDIDKETYDDLFRHRSVRNAWYTVYNMISYQRDCACTLVRRDWIDPVPLSDHGETGWLFMTTHTYFGHAQMSSNKIEQQLTTFVNDGDVASTMRTAASSNKYQVKDVKESRQHTIKNFLERPIQLPAISLAAGGGEMTVIATWNFPSLIYTFDMWKDKLRNFRFMRADMNVKVLVNASPFAVGYLIMFYSPFDAEAGVRGWSGTLANAMGYNYTLINIGNGSSGEITVPFTSPFSAYDQTAAALSDMGQVVLAICIPYQNNSGLPCSISPYVALQNIVLEVPTDTQASLPYSAPAFSKKAAPQKVDIEDEIGQAQMHSWERDGYEYTQFADESEDEEAEKNKSKIISTTLSATSRALGAFSAVPVVGSFASLGSGLMAGAAAIAKFAGYSKENNLSSNMPVSQVPAARFTNAVGLDDSVVLATHPQNRVAHDSCLFSTGQDEMSIPTIVSREAVCHRFILTQATPAGTILFCIPVMPGFNETPVGSATQADSTPLAFVASMFDYWRGGLIYKVIIAKNPFCNFRLGFAFVPGLNTSQISTSTAWETTYRTINDFRDSDSFIFKVPYQSPTHWQEVVIGTESCDYVRWGDPTVQTGSFVCYVDTVLQVNDMVPNSIGGIVLVSGDPETIKFARPTFNNAFPVTTVLLDEEVGKAQSGTGTFTGNDSGLSDNQSRVVNYTSLKHSELRAKFAEASCIGEEVSNLREVIKRFGLYTNPLGLTNFSVDTAYFGAAGGSGLACLPLWYVSWLFRFYRGGQRIKVRWNPAAGTASAPPKSISSYESLIFFTAAPFPPGGSPVTLSPAAFSHVTYGHINPVHEVNACYYRTTPIAVVSSVATNVCNTRPVVTFYIAWPGAAATDLYVMIAAADDFQFGWQVGTPRLARI